MFVEGLYFKYLSLNVLFENQFATLMNVNELNFSLIVIGIEPFNTYLCHSNIHGSMLLKAVGGN